MFIEFAELPPGSVAAMLQRDRIITRYLPLADHIARRFSGRGESSEDLLQVARVGLVHAVDRFDSTKGNNFLAFAVPTMMGEIRRHFRDFGWSMHVSRAVRDLHVEVGGVVADMLQRLSRTPTASEIAQELGVDRQAMVDCIVASNAYQPKSLDAPTANGLDARIADTIGCFDRELEAVTDRETVRTLLAGLSTRERGILEMRFVDSMTQSLIAERIGVSQMEVSRTLRRIFTKLRATAEMSAAPKPRPRNSRSDRPTYLQRRGRAGSGFGQQVQLTAEYSCDARVG